MKWTKFRIKTITDAEDMIISSLYDIGLEGAQIEDKIPLTAIEKEHTEAPLVLCFNSTSEVKFPISITLLNDAIF